MDVAIKFMQTKFINNKKGRKGTFLPLPDKLKEKKENLYQEMRQLNQREVA